MEKFTCLLLLILIISANSARAKDIFLISHWCELNEVSQDKFAEVAKAGFNVVVFGGDIEQNKAALELAQVNELKVMLVDKRATAKSSIDKGFAANLDAVIADYSCYPALWGYMICNEPHAAFFVRLGAVNKYMLKKTPGHVPFINLFPTYASAEQLGHSEYEHYVDEYMRVVRPKMLCFNHNALLENSERPDYFQNLEIIRRQGIKHKTPFSSLIPAPADNPAGSGLRRQVNTSLAYGACGIIYSGQSNSNEIKQINSELQVLSPTLMKLNSAAVYHTTPVPSGAKELPKNGLISVSGGEFVVGQFNSKDGNKYAMLVNRSLKNTSKAKIRFSQSVAVWEINRSTGRRRAVKLPDARTWTVEFKPGEGRLIRIDTMDGLPVNHWEDIPQFRPRIMIDPSAQYWNIIRAEEEGQPDLYNEGLNMYNIGRKVQDELLKDGRVDAFINRETQDKEITLEDETELTRALNCDILVSLHSDATGIKDNPGGGTWTFYADDVEGKRLAECVQMPLLDTIKTFHPEVLFRGVRTHWYRLWVLHEAGCPASLTEVLFHSNPQEREMLKNPEYQDKMAKAIARGILDYFNLK